MSKRLQVLEKPLQLRVGVQLLWISNHLYTVNVKSDNGERVEYTFPLKIAPLCDEIHTVPKSNVGIPLAELKDEARLSLKFSDKKHSRFIPRENIFFRNSGIARN
ncbi:hypothetical protein GCM10023313_17150 [Mucilaginibacter defluvii]|uniref:Uncharacterized protein n=1 Tax=Mucilaginibacter defluvii TaxID=1196019 RepID=A0ABP9FSK7_9SPHI